jgi:hypothetical protein
MKLSDIRIGERYEACVCGRMAIVRVTNVTPVPSPPWSRTEQAVVLGFDETSGRRVTIRSLQNVRRLIER